MVTRQRHFAGVMIVAPFLMNLALAELFLILPLNVGYLVVGRRNRRIRRLGSIGLLLSLYGLIACVGLFYLANSL
jgi:hypothetical protein